MESDLAASPEMPCLSDRPRVSVLIPTYNRTEELQQTLAEISRQDMSDLEIVIIDDASPNDTVRDLASQHPQLKYYRLPTNAGLIGARKIGMRMCSGKYVVSLDDDSWPMASDAISIVVEFMERNPRVAILSLNIQQSEEAPTWPPSITPFIVPQYTGCGYVARKEIVMQFGEYVPEFRRQGEEMDRSMRLIDRGFQIVAMPSIIVKHLVSPKNRDRRASYTLEFANMIRREVLRAPFVLLPFAIMRSVVFGWRRRKNVDWRVVRRELFSNGPGSIFKLFKQRKPIKFANHVSWHIMAYRYDRALGNILPYAKAFSYPRRDWTSNSCV